jgi:predicted Rossmann fold nucleotide-binding protein DprA/Smf involved in DNA uptake
VIEELPTPARAALTKLEQPEAEQGNLLVAQSLTGSGQKIYALLSSDEPRPIDDIVETIGLNSSDVLATLFDLETKGFVWQLPGKQFSKILLWADVQEARGVCRHHINDSYQLLN